MTLPKYCLVDQLINPGIIVMMNAMAELLLVGIACS